jgi:glycosyltransferase involved in cell wall biosynthesis
LYVTDAVKIGSNIKADVITAQDPFETGLVGKMLSKKLGLPLHIQIHTDFFSPYFKHSLLNKVRIALSKKTLPSAKAIRAVSDRIKNSLPAEIKEKTSVLPIFADVELIKDIPITADLRKMYPQFKKIVLMASRLTPEKDIQTGIKAFLSARKKNPEIGLIIVGSGSEEKKIKKSDSVIHLPWADYPTLISYMKTCEIFMSTSLYEGYGLSMLEAHTTGATLVATDAGIAPELSFVVAKSGDVNQISSLLSKALDGHVQNKFYVYQYISKRSYLEAYKKDIERVLI